ncbi:hypothetical protein BGZ99_007118 [Dissophora globulifera]|uniref:Uncharacterized protein n=1 Tax=Dissophora globulifera TaxID=979702 RepID=A0A9P6RRW8_9FUNG|nr:hypothetical protein BGZ99_007118 [Dissophora globulifera]
MASAIAPPASFGLISGTAFASASPAALAKILDSLDLASIELEHSRLQRAIQQLEQSNKDITEFIELEQLELQEARQASENADIDMDTFEPDPEFVLAIEENKAVIEKYERTCASLMSAIQRRHSEAATEDVQEENKLAPAGSSAVTDEADQGGIHL